MIPQPCALAELAKAPPKLFFGNRLVTGNINCYWPLTDAVNTSDI